MAHRLARTLFFVALGVLGFGLLGGQVPGTPPASTWPGITPAVGHTVFLGGDLEPEDLVQLTAAVGAHSQPGVVLLDTPKSTPYTKPFLAAFRPERVIPIGPIPGGLHDLEDRLGMPVAPPMTWQRGVPRELWRLLFPRAARVVVCPAEPRGLLLQAACLAGTVGAPLFVTTGREGELDELKTWLSRWHTHTVFAAGEAGPLCRDLPDVLTVELATEEEVAATHRRYLLRQGPITTLVVANPADGKDGRISLSCLAPWVALQRHAALLLTNSVGDNAEQIIQKATASPSTWGHRESGLSQVDSLILVADLQGIPMVYRPNPIPTDKDTLIEMEPCTPTGPEPFTFATGRLFHENPAVPLLLLARERLLLETRGRNSSGELRGGVRKALIVSDPGSSLPLLEVFSRNTVKEFRNAGYETTALFGKEVTGDGLRQMLPDYDLFLWEGHHNTLIRDWAMPFWDEPLPPSLVFLQSCLALHEWKALPLLNRGAIGVVGSSTRTYSGSGGACALAFFDALLYENQSVGSALRQSKNFLVAYSQLKEKRLGKDARRTGANVRSAWAFTLWGDPTFRLPPPERPLEALPHVCHEVHGNTITVSLPPTPHDKVVTAKYQVQMLPNARLAGLIRKDDDDEGHPLVPFIFQEVSLPKAPPGRVPQLHSRLPASHWVFCWDGRRRCGSLLIIPRSQDRDELRFHVSWSDQQSAVSTQPDQDGAGSHLADR